MRNVVLCKLFYNQSLTQSHSSYLVSSRGNIERFDTSSTRYLRTKALWWPTSEIIARFSEKDTVLCFQVGDGICLNHDSMYEQQVLIEGFPILVQAVDI